MRLINRFLLISLFCFCTFFASAQVTSCIGAVHNVSSTKYSTDIDFKYEGVESGGQIKIIRFPGLKFEKKYFNFFFDLWSLFDFNNNKFPFLLKLIRNKNYKNI